eukprot:gene11434-biopygen7224
MPCGAVWHRVCRVKRRAAPCGAVCRPPCVPPCDAVRRRVALRAVCWSPCAAMLCLLLLYRAGPC